MQKKSIRLTLLGGIDEVGGNTVLLEDLNYDIRIFLDFGIKIKKYYNKYKRKHHPSCVEENIHANLLPSETDTPIHNLYMKENNEGLEPSNLDGILISHPHKDHYFGLSFINRTIPIYTGVVTKRIIRAFCKTAEESIANNFNDLNWQRFRTGDIIKIKGMKIIPFHVDHSVPGAYGFIIYTSAGKVVYTGDFRRHGALSNMTEEFLKDNVLFPWRESS